MLLLRSEIFCWIYCICVYACGCVNDRLFCWINDAVAKESLDLFLKDIHLLKWAHFSLVHMTSFKWLWWIFRASTVACNEFGIAMSNAKSTTTYTRHSNSQRQNSFDFYIFNGVCIKRKWNKWTNVLVSSWQAQRQRRRQWWYTLCKWEHRTKWMWILLAKANQTIMLSNTKCIRMNV